MKCSKCNNDGGINFNPETGEVLCNPCYDSLHYIQPLSGAATGKKYLRIAKELMRIEIYAGTVMKDPEKYSSYVAIRNILNMVHILRRSIYRADCRMGNFKMPVGAALINIDPEDLVVKERKRQIQWKCRWCDKLFYRYQTNRGYDPTYCSRHCFMKSVAHTVNVSLLDKTAEVLTKYDPKDMNLIDALKTE